MNTAGTKVVKGYYLLAPVWFLVEWLFWPGFRAGPVVGHSTPALLGFYAMEGAIGCAYWAGLAYADKIASVENLVYFAAILSRVYMGPLKVAAAIDSAAADAPRMAAEYIHALPGEMFSAFQLVFSVYWAWYGDAFRAKPRGDI